MATARSCIAWILWVMFMGQVRGQGDPYPDPHLTFYGAKYWALGAHAPIGADLDGDGVGDLVVGGPEAQGPGSTQVGGVVLFVSGKDGTRIHRPVWGPSYHAYGYSVAGIGDFNGDGVDDVAFGSPHLGAFNFTGQAWVLSGATGKKLAKIPNPDPALVEGFGAGITGIGDLDGDGYTEFMACGWQGDLWLFSGPDGHLFRTHDNLGGNPQGIDDVGDIDGDGVTDYAVGNEYGKVWVFSGATGAIYTIIDPQRNLGSSVAGMGDVDGDQVLDFAATWDGEHDCDNGSGTGEFIEVYSGFTGTVILRIEDSRIPLWSGIGTYDACDFFDIDGGKDVNGDGVPDLVAGSIKGNPTGRCSVYSGATGAMLWNRSEWVAGVHQSLVGDLDGDGLSEWGFGDPHYIGPTGTAEGRIQIYRGGPGDAQRVCSASQNSAGTAAQLSFDGPISVSNNFLHLAIDGGVPNQVGFFFYGEELIQQPFGDGVLCAGPGTLGLKRIGSPVLLDQDGFVLMQVDMTQAPMGSGPAAWTPGSTWTVQFLYRDQAAGGAGFNLSDAVHVMFTE